MPSVKKITDAEAKYHSSRLKLYAVIWTLSRLRSYLLGVKFTVITDCRALVYLNLHKATKPQVARWYELLQEFDFDIQYKPGTRMAHVDALSHAENPLSSASVSVEEVIGERLDVCLSLTVSERVQLMQQANTVGVIRALTKLCEERGLPKRIISDRGSCFTFKSFQEFCEVRGVHHTLNSSSYPQANRQVERANRTILPILAISAQDQQRWDSKLPEIQRHLNTAYKKSTNKTPFEALHGYQPRFHGGAVRQLSQTENKWVDPIQQQRSVRENILSSQNESKLAYDKGHYDGVKFDLGEVVVMQRAPMAGEGTKLQLKYRVIPMQVIEVLPNDTYRVADVSSQDGLTYATTAHVLQLKSWKVPTDCIEGEEADHDASSSDKEEDTVEVKEPEEYERPNEPPQPPLGPGTTQTRPIRKRTVLKKLKDFIM